MKIIAVIPAYNEAAAIGKVVAEVLGYVDQVVVVDDGSADDTSLVASQAGATVLRHFLNRGQGAALQTGIFYALTSQADIIVTFDADGQFVAKQISQVVEPLLLGQTDIVLGSRFLNPIGKLPLSRRLVLQLAATITRFYTGLKVTDAHNGFRAFSAQAAEKIKIKQDRMAHASEIIEQIKKHNLKFVEVSVTVRYTDYSLQKGQKLSQSFRIIWDLIISRVSR